MSGSSDIAKLIVQHVKPITGTGTITDVTYDSQDRPISGMLIITTETDDDGVDVKQEVKKMLEVLERDFIAGEIFEPHVVQEVTFDSDNGTITVNIDQARHTEWINQTWDTPVYAVPLEDSNRFFYHKFDALWTHFAHAFLWSGKRESNGMIIHKWTDQTHIKRPDPRKPEHNIPWKISFKRNQGKALDEVIDNLQQTSWAVQCWNQLCSCDEPDELAEQFKQILLPDVPVATTGGERNNTFKLNACNKRARNTAEATFNIR